MNALCDTYGLENCSSGYKWHYHVLILLNKDTYGFLGSHRDFDNQDNLIGKIRKAWSSALNGKYDECASLVYIPENPIYYLNVKGDDYHDVLVASWFLDVAIWLKMKQNLMAMEGVALGVVRDNLMLIAGAIPCYCKKI